jgi:hypothetical protein
MVQPLFRKFLVDFFSVFLGSGLAASGNLRERSSAQPLKHADANGYSADRQSIARFHLGLITRYVQADQN